MKNDLFPTNKDLESTSPMNIASAGALSWYQLYFCQRQVQFRLLLHLENFVQADFTWWNPLSRAVLWMN